MRQALFRMKAQQVFGGQNEKSIVVAVFSSQNHIASRFQGWSVVAKNI